MYIVSISGLDGSGKSTQIQLLKNYLESQGKKVFYFHANKFSISKMYNILRPHKVLARKHNESIFKAGWLQIQLRKLALRIDIWRFGCLSNKLLQRGYDYILSDRFFWDSEINISYLNQPSVISHGSSILLSLRNVIPIYLRVSPEIIMQRERVPDQGLQYLKDKKKLYDSYFENFPEAKIIDGEKNKEEVFEDIVSIL